MAPTDNPAGQSTTELRERAERRVPTSPTDVSGMTADELGSLVHELDVHQQELVIQNEELLRAQAELRASRDRYADLYDFAPVGYMSVDRDGSIVESNLTAAAMLGTERSRLIGTRLGVYCDSTSRPTLNAHLEVADSSKKPHSCELQFNVRDGRTVDLRLHSEAAEPASGQRNIRVVITDISETKEAERALIEKDRQLHSIADALPVLIGYLDTRFRFRFGNAAHREWFGLSPEDLQGRRLDEVLGAECHQDIEGYLEDVLAGRRVDFETELEHLDKGRRYVQTMLVPDTNPDGNVQGIHSLCIDITERKVVEQQDARSRSFSDRLIRLNPDERAVYELLIRGDSNRATAFELEIGLRTAERRRRVVLKKLEVESLAELLQQLADIQGLDPNDGG